MMKEDVNQNDLLYDLGLFFCRMDVNYHDHVDDGKFARRQMSRITTTLSFASLSCHIISSKPPSRVSLLSAVVVSSRSRGVLLKQH